MNENNNTRSAGMSAPVRFRPELTFYHANPKGTGCALSMSLHPAHDRTDGCIMARFANQMTVGNAHGPTPTFPHFDWENAINVKLDFSDLCRILQVLRGECEALEGDHGLYHRSVNANTRIVLRHVLEPVSGYSLEVYRMPLGKSEDERRAHIFIGNWEALGLTEAIAGSLAVISFGIPVVLPHDTSAYTAAVKERRNAPAA